MSMKKNDFEEFLKKKNEPTNTIIITKPENILSKMIREKYILLCEQNN